MDRKSRSVDRGGPVVLHYARADRRPAWRRWSQRALSGFVVGLMAFVAGVHVLDVLFPATLAPPASRTSLQAPATEPLPPPPPLFDVEQVRTSTLAPNLAELARANIQARNRAHAVITAHFDAAHAGADDFARAIIGPLDSMKTFYLMGKGSTHRWWYEDPGINPLRDHVAWNYERHVTSGQRLERVIRIALAQFESDLRANRNLAIQSIQVDLHADALPVVVNLDEAQLRDNCDEEVRLAIARLMTDRVAEEQALASVGTEAAAAGMGSAATYVVRLLVIRLATVPASAVVGSSAAGATAGSVVPGVGTAAGFASGLLVGLAVDSVLSSRQITKVTRSVREVLTTAESALMNDSMQQASS